MQEGNLEEALKEVKQAEETAKLLLKDPKNEFFQSNLQKSFDDVFTFGYNLHNIGRFSQAQNFYELSLLISQTLLATDPANVSYQSYVGTTLNNLGTLLKNMGRIEEAKQRYENALEMRQTLLATDPANVSYQSDVAMTLNNLGNLLKNMGRIEEAKQRYENALEMRQTLLATDPANVSYQSSVAMILNNLGTLLKNMGRIEEAKQRYENALEMRQTLLATDPANVSYQSYVGGTLNNLGNLLKNMGRIEEAKQRYENALEIYETLLATDPANVSYQSYVGGTLNNLGTLLSDMGRIEEAKQRYENALEMRQTLLATDPANVSYQSSVAMILNNLGTLLSDMGRIEEAKQRYENALEIYETLLATDPANVSYQSYVGGTLNNLGTLLRSMGRIEEAKQRYENALGIYTEPMQYLTIGRKSHSIMKLIELNTEQAKSETNSHRQIKYLEEAYQLCKKNKEFFSKYGLKHEKKLVMEAGLSAYVDYVIKDIREEKDSEKRAEGYEKAIKAIEKLGKIEDDEEVEKIASSTVCYLEGRKLVNEALGSEQPDLELIKQATNQFKDAKETYKKANVCYCIYIGLLKILENVELFEEENGSKAKEMINQVIEILPENIDPGINSAFEEIAKIFDEKDVKSRKKHLEEFDGKIRAIEYKALENLFGHVQKKLKDYIEEPFSPNVIYENWKLKVIFDDPTKIKGKLNIKVGNKILMSRNLVPEEVKNNLVEIDYLKIGYFPQDMDEIYFTTSGQKKPVIRPIDYFESVGRDNKTRIFQCDCSNGVCVDRDLKIAAVQLKYHAYGENSVVKITADNAYHRKVMSILDAVKNEADIVVFPEFSIPFDFLKRIQEFADENEIIVVAGSHYVTEGQLGDYGELFCREFGEEDLRKNISPVVLPSSKIVHNEKLLGAREERELYFSEGMKAGKVNHIFKLRDDLRLGLMICYEYLNSDLRNRLISACNVILVPQTNPKPERFYEIAKADINNPLCSGNKAFIMANGIFTLEDDKKILGGSTGIVSTLDKYSYEKQDEGIIKPVDKVMEQFVLLASINTDFSPSRDTQSGQVPLKTKIIHIFEENEILSNSENEGIRFIQLLETIENCKGKEKLKEILTDEENKATINVFSPLMHKHIQDLKELTLEEMQKKCCSILIPAK
ncbi:tetratricopeptide repeat protein [Methanosarcina sp. DH1]|uniref:tetratricopeptide repeat protein n=1 Tax=Methanosarcina sp. DH1 TaxID=2605695 RepID=UPI001E407736|nr:tetratricopeptide repeat protein [Methanosarcina sp. DH1]